MFACMNGARKKRGKAGSAARAGSVIGDGNFKVDHIMPDCIRAVEKGENIIARKL